MNLFIFCHETLIQRQMLGRFLITTQKYGLDVSLCFRRVWCLLRLSTLLSLWSLIHSPPPLALHPPKHPASNTICLKPPGQLQSNPAPVCVHLCKWQCVFKDVHTFIIGPWLFWHYLVKKKLKVVKVGPFYIHLLTGCVIPVGCVNASHYQYPIFQF